MKKKDENKTILAECISKVIITDNTTKEIVNILLKYNIDAKLIDKRTK